VRAAYGGSIWRINDRRTKGNNIAGNEQDTIT